MSHLCDPLRDLFRLQDRMNQVFEELTQDRTCHADGQAPDPEGSDWVPAADVDEQEKEYVVAVDLPGIDRPQLEIELEKEKILVRGMRSIDKRETRRGERPAGRFLRRFDVPPNVDQAAITADYKDGVLMVRLPKRDQEKVARVQIQIQ